MKTRNLLNNRNSSLSGSVNRNKKTARRGIGGTLALAAGFMQWNGHPLNLSAGTVLRALCIIGFLLLQDQVFAQTQNTYGQGHLGNYPDGNKGSNNVLIGYESGFHISSGDLNTFLGYHSGFSNSIGYENVFLGAGSGADNTYGDYNVFLGSISGFKNTTGNNNTFLGYGAGGTNEIGNDNVFLGFKAGYDETGSNKLYIANSDTDSPLIWGDFADEILKVNGKLGIGITGTLTERLEVAGNIKVSGGVNAANITATSNVSAANIAASNNITATNEVSAANITAINNVSATNIAASSNITAADSVITDVVKSTGNLIAGKIGIGVDDPTEAMEVKGTIVAVKFQAFPEGDVRWPDYVFEEDYTLPKLDEVEAYVKAHRHLPGVASAKEVGEQGIDLVDMQAAQLQKIEELTLYMIDLQKENHQLKESMGKLEEKVEKLMAEKQ